MEFDMKPDELYHFGRKGMKWGQNIFGKDRTGSKRKKASRTDQGDEDVASPKPKSHKEMTDDELRRETDRLNLEANYISARGRANPPSTQPQKKESFSKKFMDEAIKPAIIAAGRKQIENYLNNKISDLTKGKVDPNSIEGLRKEAEKMGLKSKISTAKKVIDSNDRYFKEEREKEERKAAAEKQVEDYFNSGYKDDGPKSSSYAKSGEEIIDRYTQTGTSSNLPAVIKPQSSSVAKTQENLYSYSDRVYKGESYAAEILDGETGKTIVRLDANGKPKRWW